MTVDALTTEAQLTTANPDGSFTLTTSATPQRVNKSGTWVPADATLKPNSDGTLSPAAATSDLRLSGGADDTVATLTRPGAVLSYTWPTPLPTPQVTGDTATYADVLPGVDLRLKADVMGGFSEVLIVKTPAAAENPALKTIHFGLKATGVTVTSDASGTMTAKDSSGTVQFSSGAPFMWDSATTSAAAQEKAALTASDTTDTTSTSDADGPGINANSALITVTADTSGEDITPDPTLLAEPADDFPIYIDPATIPGDEKHFAEIQEGCPDASSYDIAQANGEGVGDNAYSGCIGIERSFYDLQIPSTIWGTYIKSADVYSTVTYAAASGSHSNSVRLFSSCPISDTTSWKLAPCLDSKANPLYPNPNNTASFTTSGSYPNTGVDWHLGGSVQQVADLRWPDWTIALYGQESDPTSFVRFSTDTHASITYDIPPYTPTDMASDPAPHGGPLPCDGYLGRTDSLNATLSVNVSTPTPNTLLGANFWLQDNNGTWLMNPGSTGTPSIQATAPTTVQAKKATPTLSKDHKYHWWADAYDGFKEGPKTAVCTVTVDQDSPVMSPTTSTDYPSPGQGNSTLHAGQPGTFILTATDPGANPTGVECIRWGFDNKTVDTSSYCPASSTSDGDTGIFVVNGMVTASPKLVWTPPTWGTHILHAAAVDRAGNTVSGADYQFYVPDNPNAKPSPGDVTGDGIPDLLTVDSKGNLVTVQAGTDSTLGDTIAAPVTESPDGSSWSHFQVTHRGSVSGKYVDDLIVHTPNSFNYYAYINNGDGHFSKTDMHLYTVGGAASELQCTCDLSKATQIIAIGAGDAGATNAAYPAAGNHAPSRDPVYFLAAIPDSNNHTQLWLFTFHNVTKFNPGIRISPLNTSAFDGLTLFSPGDATGDGLADLWGWNPANGNVYQFASKRNTDGTVDWLGGIGGASTQIGSKVPGTYWHTITSVGDLDGDGYPDLWGVNTPQDNMSIFLGTGGQPYFAPPVGSADMSHVTGPILNWTMGNDDGKGPGSITLSPAGTITTVTDASGNGNDGTSAAGVSATTGSSPHDGHSATFDGTTGAISAPANLLNQTTESTPSIALWFRVPNGSTKGGTLLSTGHSAPGTASPSSGAMPVLYIGYDGRLYGHFWNGNATGITTGPVNDGKWHQVVLSATSKTQWLYLDGSLVGSQNGQISDLDPLTMIGTGVYNNDGWPSAPNNNAWGYFNGAIDDVQIFDHTVGAGEARNLFNAQKIAPVMPADPTVTPAPKTAAGVTSGCLPSGPYGNVDSVNPTLSAGINESDEYTPVTGTFTYWDETTGGAHQSIKSTAIVGGNATVAPVLVNGHQYAWNVTTTDGQTTSPASATCHFIVNATGTPVTTPPTAEWLLDDATGTTAADYGATGAFPGTLSATGVNWGSGYAAFDGTTGTIATSGPVLDTTQSYTVSAWVKINDTSTFHHVMSEDGANGSGFYLLYDKNKGTWAFYTINADTNSPTSWPGAVSNIPATVGAWTQLTGVYDAGTNTFSLYVNGQLAGTGAGPAQPWNATGSLRIGAGKVGGVLGSFFAGDIADPLAYQQALTPDQATWLYKNSDFTAPASLANGKPVTASSTLTGWPASDLTDGILNGSATNHGWSSGINTAADATEWAQVDLGGTHTINEIDLFPRDDSTNVVGYCFPSAFTISVSTDGTNWTTVVTETGYPKPGDTAQTFPITPIAARYIKVTGTTLTPDQYGNYYMQLQQLTAYGT